MDPVILVAIIVGGFVLLALFLNRKLSQMGENQKPSEELLEVIKMLQTGSK
jgi:hypothetical protein